MKAKLEFVEYLNILDYRDSVTVCRFRTTNNKLFIETGKLAKT
jgi:hypothetical protein